MFYQNFKKINTFLAFAQLFKKSELLTHGHQLKNIILSIISMLVNMIRCVIDTFCCQFGHKRYDRWGSWKMLKKTSMSWTDDKNIWHPADVVL